MTTTKQPTGDLMGPLSKLPTETVYTPAERAAAVMLAALQALVVSGNCPLNQGATIRAAIAQAKAAGIEVIEGWTT